MKEIEWILPQTPVSEDDLSSVIAILKQPLPDDFKRWLLNHNGAAPKPSELSLEDGLILIINCFVSFSHSDTPNVVSTLDMLGSRLPDGLIPFAEDHGGNYVCFRYDSEESTPSVVLWSHEEANSKRAIMPVASSFTELVERLRRGAT